MPTYEIEQYETHAMRYRIDAANQAEAIANLFRGYALPVDDSLEYVEVCEDRGLPAEEPPRLVEELQASEIAVDDVIPSIRSIAEVE